MLSITTGRLQLLYDEGANMRVDQLLKTFQQQY